MRIRITLPQRSELSACLPRCRRDKELQGSGTMYLRRLAAAPVAALTLMSVAPAAAQMSGAALLEPLELAPNARASRSNAPNFRMPEGDLRYPGDLQRGRVIATFSVNRNLDIGLGRFSIP